MSAPKPPAFRRRKRLGPQLRPPPGIATGARRPSIVNIEGRSGRPKGTIAPRLDQFGLPSGDPRYATLGPRCRENIRRALDEGIVYTGTSGTTEEMIVYGELRRRGFERGLVPDTRDRKNPEPNWFLYQADEGGGRSRDGGGSVVDFEVHFQGEKIALRPQNSYWHGGLDKREQDEKRADRLREIGFDRVCDIWSADVTNDFTLELIFNNWFGA